MDLHTPGAGIARKSDDIWECVQDLLMMSDGVGQVAVAALPSVRNLRSLVVIRDRRAAARLVRGQFGTGSLRRRLQAQAAAAAIATGLAPKVPALYFVDRGPNPGLGYLTWLQQALPREARVGAILLGPPRANRKPVALMTDGKGRLMAVAKFGVNRVTRQLVKHEASALLQVGSALRGTVHVPKLVASGAAVKGEALLMAPLPAASSGRRPTRSALIEVVRAVGAADRSPGDALHDIASHPRLAPLHPHIDGIRQCLEGVQLGSFHGDLHPGNLALANDKRLILWDWERWGRGAPVGFDLLHHDLHSWITQDGVAPKDAARTLVSRASEILYPLGVRPTTAPAVARDYLIRLAARYASDDQQGAGSALGKVEQWLFPAVIG